MPSRESDRWPDATLDRHLILACRAYRKGFDEYGDGTGRALLTRLNADCPDLNVLIVMLPAGWEAWSLLNYMEEAIGDWLSDQSEPGESQTTERVYDDAWVH